jgi:hypothetical protein
VILHGLVFVLFKLLRNAWDSQRIYFCVSVYNGQIVLVSIFFIHLISTFTLLSLIHGVGLELAHVVMTQPRKVLLIFLLRVEILLFEWQHSSIAICMSCHCGIVIWTNYSFPCLASSIPTSLVFTFINFFLALA